MTCGFARFGLALELAPSFWGSIIRWNILVVNVSFSIFRGGSDTFQCLKWYFAYSNKLNL